MASTSSSTRPRDPGRRVLELRSQGASSAAIRADLRAAGYSEATIRNAVPGDQTEPVEPVSTPVDDAPAEPVEAVEEPPADAEPPRTSREGRTMPRLSLPAGGDAAGFVLGVFGMALVVNYMRGGPDQVKAWARAKFLNDAVPAGSATKGTPGTGAANIYNVHAAMTRAQYNAAHPSGAGVSKQGGQVKGT